MPQKGRAATPVAFWLGTTATHRESLQVAAQPGLQEMEAPGDAREQPPAAVGITSQQMHTV